LLAKILEGLVSRSYIKDKFLHHEEVHIVPSQMFTIISPLPPLSDFPLQGYIDAI